MNKTNSILSTLKGSDLIRNISILVSGTTIAQLIPILLQPLLRRYFSPEEFGAYAVYLSLIGILIVIASMKYELAIILPEKDKTATNILALAVLINLAFSFILLFIIILFKRPVSDIINLPEQYSIYLYFVPLGVFLYSMYQSINYWLIRKKLFFSISLNKFIRRGTEGSSQIMLMFSKVSPGLVIGDVIGHFANCGSAITQALRNDVNLMHVSIIKLKYVFKKYLEYPKYNVIPSFMSACSYLLPVIFINKFFSSEYTGYFDLSKLMLSIPLALIATSISNVLLQRVSEKYRNNKSFIRELLPVISIVAVIGIVEIVVITFFAVDLFELFFGDLWGFSGRISRILVWSYAFNFFVASFSSLFISMNKIKLLSIWQLFYFVSILLLLFFKNYSFIDFLKVYVIIEIVCFLIIAIMMVIIVARYEALKRSCKG
ncbi:hypothetical protein ES708_22873 [subsurface metagenome]